MREVQRELKQLIRTVLRSEEHTSELQSRLHLVCRLLLEKKNLALALKGVKFFDHVDASDLVEQAKRYHVSGADELLLYDITASHEDRYTIADLPSELRLA